MLSSVTTLVNTWGLSLRFLRVPNNVLLAQFSNTPFLKAGVLPMFAFRDSGPVHIDKRRFCRGQLLCSQSGMTTSVNRVSQMTVVTNFGPESGQMPEAAGCGHRPSK